MNISKAVVTIANKTADFLLGVIAVMCFFGMFAIPACIFLGTVWVVCKLGHC
jgi:hypothetical protein